MDGRKSKLNSITSLSDRFRARTARPVEFIDVFMVVTELPITFLSSFTRPFFLNEKCRERRPFATRKRGMTSLDASPAEETAFSWHDVTGQTHAHGKVVCGKTLRQTEDSRVFSRDQGDYVVVQTALLVCGTNHWGKTRFQCMFHERVCVQGFELMGWIIRAFLGTFSGWFPRLVQDNLNVNIM